MAKLPHLPKFPISTIRRSSNSLVANGNRCGKIGFEQGSRKRKPFVTPRKAPSSAMTSSQITVHEETEIKTSVISSDIVDEFILVIVIIVEYGFIVEIRNRALNVGKEEIVLSV